LAFVPIESFEGGVEEFPEFIPSRRRNSAFSVSRLSTRAASPTTSAANSSYDGWGDSGADTTPMIDDQPLHSDPDTPSPITHHTKINSLPAAQLNRAREWTPSKPCLVAAFHFVQ
jgi:hypothetical protein